LSVQCRIGDAHRARLRLTQMSGNAAQRWTCRCRCGRKMREFRHWRPQSEPRTPGCHRDNVGQPKPPAHGRFREVVVSSQGSGQGDAQRCALKAARAAAKGHRHAHKFVCQLRGGVRVKPLLSAHDVGRAHARLLGRALRLLQRRVLGLCPSTSILPSESALMRSRSRGPAPSRHGW